VRGEVEREEGGAVAGEPCGDGGAEPAGGPGDDRPHARPAISDVVATHTSSWPVTKAMKASRNASRPGRPMICGCMVNTQHPPISRMPRNSSSQSERTVAVVAMPFVQEAPPDQKCGASS